MLDTNNASDLRLSGKFGFVTSSNKLEKWYERAMKPEVGYVLKLTGANRSYQNTCLLTRHQDVAPVRAFSLSILAANRCAITRTSANRETLYTDECLMNHGTVELCKLLLETGKWLTLAIGSRNERLIIELHRLADNSIEGYLRGYGYSVKG